MLSLLSLLHSIMIRGSMTCSFPFLDAIMVEGDLLSVVLLVLKTLWCIAAVLRRRVAHRHIHRPTSLLVLRYRFWLCAFDLVSSQICQKLLDDPVRNNAIVCAQVIEHMAQLIFRCQTEDPFQTNLNSPLFGLGRLRLLSVFRHRALESLRSVLPVLVELTRG